MRMLQSEIENIVARRNAKLLADSTRGWSAGARRRLRTPINLGTASPELQAAMRQLDAGMRNHRSR